ncbi:MAG TPA: hypothetical protein VGX03_39795 [Candidatus Binatia bacterium]|nr:hypothetical protein [Candidatus Binatia bacterium]
MTWNDIREVGNILFDLPFEATIKLNLTEERLARRHGRRIALDLIEAQIFDFSVSLAHAFSHSRDLFANNINLSPSSVELLIPWLSTSTPRERIQMVLQLDSLSTRFDLGRPLDGQNFQGELAVAAFALSAYRDLQMQPVSFVIRTLDLIDGCLEGRIKAWLRIAKAALLLAHLAVTTFSSPQPPNNASVQEEINRVVQGQRCTGYVSWNYDADKLKKLTTEALNYTAPGITEQERIMRTCTYQVVSRIVQGSPTQIDGIAGSNTSQSVNDYGRRKNLPGDIRDETLRAQLLQDLERHFKELEGR